MGSVFDKWSSRSWLNQFLCRELGWVKEESCSSRKFQRKNSRKENTLQSDSGLCPPFFHRSTCPLEHPASCHSGKLASDGPASRSPQSRKRTTDALPCIPGGARLWSSQAPAGRLSSQQFVFWKSHKFPRNFSRQLSRGCTCQTNTNRALLHQISYLIKKRKRQGP